MLEKIKKLSDLLCESYSEKSLYHSLKLFFEQDFGVDVFYLSFDNNDSGGSAFIYPLYKDNQQIAKMVFSEKTAELVTFLDVFSPFISLKIQNIILNDKMQKDIDFQDTMKNIAKIIEAQYELSYIVPLIGEIIDKFFENYLIYIYLKSEDDPKKNILAWPTACNDPRISEVVPDLEMADLSDDNKIYSYPLISESDNIGMLVAKSTEAEITQIDKEYFVQLAQQIATTITRANVYSEILKHATLDALTGFYNRSQLEERIRQEVANAKRQHAPLCGIMTDIDYFKKVNDTYGHAAGDLVLKTIAKVIRSQLREYDIAGRYGGEEFSLLLPFTNINEAQMVAERLRKTIENTVIDISKVNNENDVREIKITLSLGVYQIKEADGDSDLLKKADKALYKAKNTGRNKVVINDD